MKKVLWIFFLFLLQTPAFAVQEILIEQVSLQDQPPDRYDVVATLSNATDQPREVTLRAQVFFFERVSPQGDQPAMVLRKDETLILKEKEIREIKIRLLNEGTLPKGRLRAEPEIRLRRQRVWNY